MENIELAKAERDNAWEYFKLRISNIDIILPIAFYFLCSVGFGLTSAIYTGDSTIVRILFILLSGIAVRMFTDHWNKIQEKSKIRHKAFSAVRNLDSIRLSLKRIENSESENSNLIARIKDIDWNIQNSIDEWSDILPEIKQRDLSRLLTEFSLLQKKLDTLPPDKPEDKEKIEEEMEKQKAEILRNIESGDFRIKLNPKKRKGFDFDDLMKFQQNYSKMDAMIKATSIPDLINFMPKETVIKNPPKENEGMDK